MAAACPRRRPPDAVQLLRAVEAHPSARDRALVGIPFYAGASIAEIVRLDTGDVPISAGEGVLRIHGRGERIRHVPIHPKLRNAIQLWLAERPDWPGADTNPALFLNGSVASPHRGVVRQTDASCQLAAAVLPARLDRRSPGSGSRRR